MEVIQETFYFDSYFSWLDYETKRTAYNPNAFKYQLIFDNIGLYFFLVERPMYLLFDIYTNQKEIQIKEIKLSVYAGIGKEMPSLSYYPASIINRELLSEESLHDPETLTDKDVMPHLELPEKSIYEFYYEKNIFYAGNFSFFKKRVRWTIFINTFKGWEFRNYPRVW